MAIVGRLPVGRLVGIVLSMLSTIVLRLSLDSLESHTRTSSPLLFVYDF